MRDNRMRCRRATTCRDSAAAAATQFVQLLVLLFQPRHSTAAAPTAASTVLSPSSIHFAVHLVIQSCEADPFHTLAAQTSIRSLVRQTHRQWRLVVTGDNLDLAAMARLRTMLGQNGIPSHRW